MAKPTLFVSELQGLYGPFTMAERVVQKIWLQQDFATAGARLQDGRRIEVISPGRWNLLGGPDFRGARLRFDGREVTGDVEVHFHSRDWTAHQHAANPAYDNVVLHVLLFPPDLGARVERRRDRAEIPALVLLPLLHRDLEEYAADDALESLTARDEWRRLEELASEPPDAVRAKLRALGFARWQRKLGYARARIAKLGWEAAAHHTALEILGYRHNRVPMLAVAERWPIHAWRGGVNLGDLLLSVPGWQRHGVRPANHPLHRLTQYQQWIAAAPDWPERLAHLARSGAPYDADAAGTRDRRASQAFATWRDGFEELVKGRVGGSRFNTLVCDGFLPLAAALVGREDLAAAWFDWPPGDLPDRLRRGLRKLDVSGTHGQAHCHGLGQGLLAWLIEREICT